MLAALERRGASFFHDLTKDAGLLPTRVERALGELVALGLVTADGFAGLRALLAPPDQRKPLGGAGSVRRRRTIPDGVETAGRWSPLRLTRGFSQTGPVAQGFSQTGPVAQGFSPVLEHV